MFVDQNSYITPYLPRDAVEDGEAWQSKGKPVLQRVIPMNPNALCRNCQDAQFILVSFCAAGPFRQVPGISKTEAITWGPNGWYIVKKTISYTCPHCAGKPYELAQNGPAAEPPQWWQDA